MLKFNLSNEVECKKLNPLFWEVLRLYVSSFIELHFDSMQYRRHKVREYNESCASEEEEEFVFQMRLTTVFQRCEYFSLPISE